MVMKQFSSRHYVPILRWKEAERTALSQLHESDSIFITPLIELVPENFIRKDRKGKIIILNTDGVINKFVGQLYQSWGERPFFIDQWLLTPTIIKQDTSYVLEMLGECASIHNLSLIPVTGLSRDVLYQASLKKVLGVHHQGACLRLFIDDITSATFKKDINTILALLKLPLESLDIIIDLRITDQNAPTFDALCSRIPYLEKWRNLIIASGAFPEDLSKLHKNDIHYLERTDWISWKDQVTSKSLPRLPIYSDYTIQHAKYIMREGQSYPSASIRYTSDDYWLIMRGEAIKRDGPGSAQWQANAMLLCDMPEYCNHTFSEGNKYIKEISLQRKETGNTTTWLRAGINHHMTFVVRQLASISAASTAALS
jgi:hypothetical protein